ncbi:hypothetical protein [Amycolatopsis viridis]|uniref:J domain-containing protein n=1 Tax=Amycolatopsis viridis TaxID=185678 RepID=A0ABX0SSX6_9PSEU|nr:hypothetical protein [Amycolatopsis viridis]NIH79740.1 hypothetical protein [Amycolatopsis viridis]
MDAAGGFDRDAFRAFVRAHHPDVGGDPEVFREGLRRFQAARARPAARAGRIVFVRRRRGLAGLVQRWQEASRRRRRPPRVR